MLYVQDRFDDVIFGPLTTEQAEEVQGYIRSCNSSPIVLEEDQLNTDQLKDALSYEDFLEEATEVDRLTVDG